MKRAYVALPLIAAVAFAGYYAYWQSSDNSRHPVPSGPPDAYLGRSGEQEAQSDLRSGKRAVLMYGLPNESDSEFREILERKYRINLRAIAGCMVSQPLIDYAADYNRVMEAEIKKEFGSKVFARAEKEAQTLYTQRHDPVPAPHPK